jgi:flagellar hook-associated protein 1 FlgK
MAIKISGQQPNDLLDKRDLLLDQLSELGDIRIYEQGNGSISVQLGNRVLVEGDNVNTLETKSDDEGMYMVIWSDTEQRIQLKGARF